jgi:hypothetical protein
VPYPPPPGGTSTSVMSRERATHHSYGPKPLPLKHAPTRPPMPRQHVIRFANIAISLTFYRL